MTNPYPDYKYGKITMPREDAAKYTFSQPPSSIVFYDTSTGNQREVMRITKDGVMSNPNIPTDEGAKAIIRALDAYIKNLIQRTWVGLTDEERDEICLGDESIARSIEAKLREKNGGNHGS